MRRYSCPDQSGPEIMAHVGCSRRHTALYYTQLAKVLNPSGASTRLFSTEVNEVV